MRQAIPAVVAVFGLLGVAGVSLAQDPAAIYERREEIMHNNGAAARTIGQMVQGEAPFDEAAVIAAAESLIADAEAIPDAWAENVPGGSDDSGSSPAIWEDKAAFDAIAAEMGTAAAAVRDAAPQGVEAVAAAFGGVGATCQTCHQQFRTN
jgi:cytochrome c556